VGHGRQSKLTLDRLSGVLAIVYVLLLAVVTGCAPAEPAHNGKKLSAWLDELRDDGQGNHAAAIQAIRQMGSTAIPWLVSELDYDDPPGRALFKLFTSQMLSSERNRRAARGLIVLGPLAKPGVPQFIEIVRRHNTSAWSSPLNSLMHFLPALGEDAAPVWEAALHHPDRSVAEEATKQLAKLNADSNKAP
jgi:hypothetical protein